MALAPRLALLGVPSSVEHRLVEQPLVVGRETFDGRGDGLDDAVDGLADSLAAVPLAAVAELDGLERTGGGAAGHHGPGERAVVEEHLDLDGGVAARVEDLAGADSFDGCHAASLAVWTTVGRSGQSLGDHDDIVLVSTCIG